MSDIDRDKFQQYITQLETSFKTSYNDITTILDVMVETKAIHGYLFRHVLQFGEGQGIPKTYNGLPQSMSKSLSQRLINRIQRLNFNQIPKKAIYTEKLGDGTILNVVCLVGVYDINVGSVYLISNLPLQTETLKSLGEVIERQILNSKLARTLEINEDFSRLKLSSQEQLLVNIGTLIHNAITPIETIVMTPDTKLGSYVVNYSHKDANFTIPIGAGLVDFTFRSCEQVYVDDLSDMKKIRDLFGTTVVNKSLITYRKYKSLVITPVRVNGQVRATILTFFRRRNAASFIEKEIMSAMANVCARYLQLYEMRKGAIETRKRADDVFDLVKQSLLIAEILHDANDYMVTARGQLAFVTGKNAVELEALDSAKKQLKKLIEASNQFKDFFQQKTAHTEASSLGIRGGRKRSTVKISKVAEEVLDRYNSNKAYSGILFINNIDHELKFKCIEYSLSRAIDNAVRNSVFHLAGKAEKNLRISVSAKMTEFIAKSGQEVEGLEVTIHDNGGGIPAEVKGMVAEPFYSSRGGMGLGLTIIEAAAEAHDGKIQIESEYTKFCRVQIYFASQ